MATGSRSELISVLGDVKARVVDKLGIADFPMPQFILIGKQSVGKSRLCEALAGETFNFISGTLGSRRPTVLEFRNVPSATKSRWFVRDRDTNQWKEHPVEGVMKIVGDAHEELGENTSELPVYVRLESAASVDMQIVDLPGFRDFAMDPAKQKLGDQIVTLVYKFMEDKRNVMLCVEQASDAATMSTLAKCRQLDPTFQRTILIRNKLDKYYSDLTPENINEWVNGYGDLPEELTKISLTLPFWQDGHPPPKSFSEMREEKSNQDVQTLQAKGLSADRLKSIGFKNFQSFMEDTIEKLFVEALGPLMTCLRGLRETTDKRAKEVEAEYHGTDPSRIVNTCRDVGISFAAALSHVMEGLVQSKENRVNLETELKEFHAHHAAVGNGEFPLLPNSDMGSLQEYVEFLRDGVQVAAFEATINGGAQFRRLLLEIEVFVRFSEISAEIKKRDVIQARGVSMTSLTWRDVVVKILQNQAHLPLKRRVLYAGERMKWFFMQQKGAVLEFMSSLEGTSYEGLYSPSFPEHANLLENNPMIKQLVFAAYDDACDRQCKAFVDLFENMLAATFANPWVFLKGYTPHDGESGKLEDTGFPSFDETQRRIPEEIEGRTGIEDTISNSLQDISTSYKQIDEAVDHVHMLVLKTYSFIRSQVCDQIELYGDSFFKLPMIRKLEEDMSNLDLSEDCEAQYEERRDSLTAIVDETTAALSEIDYCLQRLDMFKIKTQLRDT